MTRLFPSASSGSGKAGFRLSGKRVGLRLGLRHHIAQQLGGVRKNSRSSYPRLTSLCRALEQCQFVSSCCPDSSVPEWQTPFSNVRVLPLTRTPSGRAGSFGGYKGCAPPRPLSPFYIKGPRCYIEKCAGSPARPCRGSSAALPAYGKEQQPPLVLFMILALFSHPLLLFGNLGL